ncbi:hypothetical protein PUN28_009301 [Cardiocondyla obscurior]|uniref:Uncharacterized protein n=1 Tax=Cardiocondyla obscurior TaxID=286306 RepID=A0AAW2FTP1_9HYME
MYSKNLIFLVLFFIFESIFKYNIIKTIHFLNRYNYINKKNVYYIM